MEIQVRPLEPTRDEDVLSGVRAFVREDLFSRALLHGSLESPPLLARARHLAAFRADDLVGAAVVIEDVFPYRSVTLGARLPGVPRALLGAIDGPFRCLAPERLWPELGRVGGARDRGYLQLARLQRGLLPEPDPEVKRLDDPEELRAFLGDDFGGLRLQMGPFVGVRDDGGRLVAVGGAEFVTPALAQIAFVQTREDHRRQGHARAVVAELVRELESVERRVVLMVHMENAAAVSLYAGLGFRGARRLVRFSFA